MSDWDAKLEDVALASGTASDAYTVLQAIVPGRFSSREVSCGCWLSGGSGGNWPGKRGLGYVGGGGGLRRTEVGGGDNGNPSGELMASAADAADAA